MATKKYLDYTGLERLVHNLEQKYAPIAAILFKGSVDGIEDLPVLSTQKSGWMYNIKVGGISTDDFVEGAGHLITDGENVAVVELITGYTAVPSAQVTEDKDPKALGWYESDGAAEPTYTLSEDRIADPTKTYYTADTVKKWDLLGGVFDLEYRYLEFGKEMPTDPDDGRTYLYMGEDTFEYNEVASPEGRPVDNGYYEKVDAYEAVTPVGDEDPSALGWYESDGLIPPTYTLTSDTEVDPLKTYYNKVDDYIPSTDVAVDPSKTYYTKDAVLKTGTIYEYDETAGEWEPKSSGGADDMIPITNREIDNLFI